MIKTSQEIKAEVSTIIARVCSVSVDAISMDDLIEDLSADSIQLFELLLAFEKEYGIEAVYEDVLGLENVGDIVSYIERVVYAKS